MIKKFICFYLSTLLLLTPAVAETIYEESTARKITRGVTHTYTERLTDGYWQKINVIEADLNDENVDIAALFSKDGISDKETLSSLAKSSGAVAAINADFFDTTTPSGKTTPLGLTVSDGKIISSASHDTGLAAIAEIDGSLMTGYFQTEIYLHAENGNKMQILHINKYHSTNSMVLFTSDFGSVTPKNTDDSAEMTVVGDTVTSITYGIGETPIPENGYILKVNPAINNFFAENFEVGDKAEITVSLSPDLGEIKTAVGGGTVLVKNGKVASFTHNISGNNPRSAAGISKDGKKLYLVTVEGREQNTPGMSQTALANLLISLGAYSAINFDGGGSTEMVTRNDSGNIEITNTPSDGGERAISTALGIKSVGKNPYFASMTLSASKENVCLGDYVQIWAAPFDNYHNPTVIGNEISFSADDGGRFEGNAYYPSSAGVRTVTATYNGVTASIKVNVLSDIANITFYPETFNGDKGYLSVVASDSNGFKSQLSPEVIGWRVEEGDGSVSFGNIKAHGKIVVSATFSDKIIKTTINGEYKKSVLFDKFNTEIKNPDFVILPEFLPDNTFINNVVNERIMLRSAEYRNAFSMGDAGEDAINLNNTSQKVVNNTKIITLQNHIAPSKALSSWKSFLNLESENEQNVVIYLAGGDNFCDETSKRMFDKTLIKLYNLKKNVFVISHGDENSFDIDSGIRYIKIKEPKISLADFTNTFDNALYLKFKINGDKLFYEWAKFF